ncbi:MAG: hypothetical protein EOP06_26535, partial [Proteobacteria bacterium]
MSDWKTILEASLTELLQLQSSLIGLDHEKSRYFYVQVLIAYFRQDKQTLLELAAENNDGAQFRTELLTLTKMRIELRSENTDLTAIERLRSELSSSNELWRAEAAFISATSHQEANFFAESARLYREAAGLFLRSGITKKSLRSKLSELAALTCLKPNLKLFAEYMLIHDEALVAKEFLT